MTDNRCERRNTLVLTLGKGVVLASLVVALTSHAYDWLQFDGTPAHGGVNPLERSLGARTVGTLALKYTATLPATADGAPTALRGVDLPSGPTDMLFVTTRNGDLVALDASTGATLWSKSHGPGACRINNTGGPCYTTSSPAIDPSRLYVYSYGLDGFVHKHRVVDGAEIITAGWPELATLKPFDEKGSSALSFATTPASSYLYVVQGGYPGDNGDYQGHVTSIDLASGAQTVFNAMCSDIRAHLGPGVQGPLPPPANPYCMQPRSAIWSRPGVIYDGTISRLFVATGNGNYTGNSDGHDWSESILALNPDGTSVPQRPLDSYTPSNYQSLDAADADLGSAVIAIIPMPGGSAVAHVGVQGGKDAKLRLVNLDNLSNVGTVPVSGHLGGEIGTILDVPQGGGVFAQPAVWTNPSDGKRWVFVATSAGISGLQLRLDSHGNPSLVPQWTQRLGGTSVLIAHNVLYYAGNGALRAVDPLTGDILWTSPNGQVGSIHWQSPIVFNGAVYVTDQNAHLLAYTPTSAAADSGFDVNADARSDIAWRSADGATSVWQMSGLDAAAVTTLSTDANVSLAGVADFNGDGKSDLVWRNAATGATSISLMDGSSATASAVEWPNNSWVPRHFADFNGDGFADIAWQNISTGATALWLMNGLTSIGAAAVTSNGSWTIDFTADFDGDGIDDLVWRNATTGQTAVWLMNGLQPRDSGVVIAPPWIVIATGDFNGDGKADLVAHNTATGATAIWLMDGLHPIASRTIFTDVNWGVIQVADFNGDGRSDLLWRNAATGAIALWLMDAFTPLDARVLFTYPDWVPTQVGDTNGDGNADIFWRHSVTGATAEWLMSGANSLSARILSPDSGMNLISPTK